MSGRLQVEPDGADNSNMMSYDACWNRSTASVVIASFLDIALQRIVGESFAFINATSAQWADSVLAEPNQ